MAKQGRPSRFNQKLADEICRRLSAGQSLREICRDDGMPSEGTVRGWAVANVDEFASQYARAREAQIDRFAEELLEISDESSNDWMERKTRSGETETVPNLEHINRSRLRVDTRKWLMSKIMPKKYGDKLDVEHSGKDGGPIKTEARVVRVPLKDILEAPIVKPLIRDDDDRPSINGSGRTH